MFGKTENVWTNYAGLVENFHSQDTAINTQNKKMSE